MRSRTLVVVALVVLAGCAAPLADSSADRSLDADRDLGYVGEYAHDDVLEIDASDGLSQAELEALTYRSMARIEVLRGLKFEEDVDVRVVTREEYREGSTRGDQPAHAWTNELWRGAFVVDGETDVNRALDDLYGGAVQGYYSSSSGDVVIVTDESDEIAIDRATLVHELVHALQDQHFGLERHGTTLDAQRAETGLIEGEANYVPFLYEQRCGEEWECIPPQSSTAGAASDSSFNVGLFLSIYAPYSEGPSFVQHLHEERGWAAVDAAYDDRPASTSQLISPDRYPDIGPVEVELEDRSNDEWEPFTLEDGALRTETVGEATLFATLWANGVIDRPLTEGGTALSPYNYSHPTTDGWVGDAFLTYEDAENRTAHVWTLAFETDDDAEAFADAYRALLENRDAELLDGDETDSGRIAADTYRIADGESFEGAYRLSVDGDRVEIVGGPTAASLEELRPAAAMPNLDSPTPIDVNGGATSPAVAIGSP